MEADHKAFAIKDLVDDLLTEADGFESYMFKVGSYNAAVGAPFQLPYENDTMALLILSTPDMFDVSFRKWIVGKSQKFDTFEEMEDSISSPIQSFLDDRLYSVQEKLKEIDANHELIHDYSMTPQRRPRILMQTCGHVAGAAFYYQPAHVNDEEWPPRGKMGPNLKFIGLSLHPVFGGHFAFRSVFIFPNVKIPQFEESVPRSLLSSLNEVRTALEKFNYSWKDSGFRDFGGPKRRYSPTQMEFFGRPVSERWEVLRRVFASGEDVKNRKTMTTRATTSRLLSRLVREPARQPLGPSATSQARPGPALRRPQAKMAGPV
ncbi:unnamed protein product [Caenorhabditis auriculariae]|uniref:Cyanocobalamin reductase (cyanide-eliminating) n=1 Tax=Caenorhabditis auriculariae TaxID=2777116 RepID=A0A8S1HMN3_9PELO|nr:unnamed protein product [Caenorhabditis auriculariae]